MKDDKTSLSTIDRKMTIIIALLNKIAHENSSASLKDQIGQLDSLGLSTSEIASILGKKVGYISKEVSTLKKK
jgi:hypothetical protein